MNHQSLAWSRGSQEARRVAASTRYVYEKTLSVAGTYDLMSIADDKGRRINPKGSSYKIIAYTVIGGGGGGGGGADYWSSISFGSGGGGGGSGYLSTGVNYKIGNKLSSLSVVVGAAGAGGPHPTQIADPSFATYGGKTGGVSSLTINAISVASANGGTGGYPGQSRRPAPYPYQGAGGTGLYNGSGGAYAEKIGGSGGQSPYNGSIALGAHTPLDSSLATVGQYGGGGGGGGGSAESGYGGGTRSSGAAGGAGYVYIKIEYYVN